MFTKFRIVGEIKISNVDVEVYINACLYLIWIHELDKLLG